MRHRILVAALVLPLVLVVPAPAGGADGAESTSSTWTSVSVPGLNSYADIVTDVARGRLFVSQGATRNVVVVGLDGGKLGELELPGATSMTTDPAGLELYASLPTSHQIAAVDLLTLEVRSFDLGADVCPRSLAASLGVVWFVDSCAVGVGQVRGLDLATGEVVDTGVQAVRNRYDEALVYASPLVPETVFVTSTVQSDVTREWYSVVGAFDVDRGSRTSLLARATVRMRTLGGHDLAVTPDGSQIVVTAADRHPRFRTSDLTRAGSYEGVRTPGRSVAVRSDGVVAVANGSTVELYGPGDVAFGSAPTGPGILLDRSLRFAGGRMFAVKQVWGRAAVQLAIADPPDSPTDDAGTQHFGLMEVAESHDHIFVGGDRGTLAVTDLSGGLTREIPLGHLTSMALGDGGDVLYVALPDESDVAVVDAETLAVRRIHLPRAICPVDVAYAADRLWVGDACEDRPMALHAIDPEDGSVTRGLGPGGHGLISSLAQPDSLVSCETAYYSDDRSTLRVYDLADWTGEPLTPRATSDPGSCEAGVRLRADAPGLLVGTTPVSLELEPEPGYPWPEWRYAYSPVDQRADGIAVSGGWVYRPGRLDPVATVAEGTFGWGVQPSAVRMGRDDAYSLFQNRGVPRIEVFDPDETTTPPLIHQSRVTLQGSRNPTANEPFDVHIHLESAEPRGEVVVGRRLLSDAFGWEEVFRGRVDARGNLTVPVTVSAASYVYVDYFGADRIERTHTAITVSPRAAVDVRPLDARRRSGSTYVYNPRSTVRLATRLAPADRRRCVTLRLQRFAAGRWAEAGTRCVTVDGRGRATTAVRSSSFTAGRAVRIRAQWPTTDRARAGVSRWVHVRFVRRS